MLFKVIVTCSPATEDVNYKDANDMPPEETEYAVMAENEEQATEIALDKFNEEVAISMPEDFDINAEVVL